MKSVRALMSPKPAIRVNWAETPSRSRPMGRSSRLRSACGSPQGVAAQGEGSCRRWAPGRCRTCRPGFPACRPGRRRCPPGPAAGCRQRSGACSGLRWHRRFDVEAVVLGVVAAHDALQLGEFANHVGEQIGLGQQGGLVRLPGQFAAPRLSAMARAMAATRSTRSPWVPSLL